MLQLTMGEQLPQTAPAGSQQLGRRNLGVQFEQNQWAIWRAKRQGYES
jgi:hypothetical protein